MADSKPPHPWMTLQIVTGPASSGSSIHSCMDFTLRPCPARFSRPQWHADPESTIQERRQRLARQLVLRNEAAGAAATDERSEVGGVAARGEHDAWSPLPAGQA